MQLLPGDQPDNLCQLLAGVAARSHKADLHTLDEPLVGVEWFADINVSHHDHDPAGFDTFKCRFDHFSMWTENHNSVRALATGQIARFLDKITGASVDRMSGTVLFSHIQLGLDRIDCDDFRSASLPALDCVQPQTTQTHHHEGLRRFKL